MPSRPVPTGPALNGPAPNGPAPTRRPPTRRAAVLLLALLLALTAVSGCARVRAALAVQADDTVNGEIVLATPATSADDAGPAISIQEEIEDAVEVVPYRQDGYAGTLVRFTGLTFDQLALLPAAAGPNGAKVRFALRRAGNRLIVSGEADLTSVPVDKADFQLKITTFGEVLESNGDADGGTASWTFTAGEVGDISAVVAVDDPNAPSPLNWTLVMAGLVALACLAVAVLARRTRNPPLRR